MESFGKGWKLITSFPHFFLIYQFHSSDLLKLKYSQRTRIYYEWNIQKSSKENKETEKWANSIKHATSSKTSFLSYFNIVNKHMFWNTAISKLSFEFSQYNHFKRVQKRNIKMKTLNNKIIKYFNRQENLFNKTERTKLHSTMVLLWLYFLLYY